MKWTGTLFRLLIYEVYHSSCTMLQFQQLNSCYYFIPTALNIVHWGHVHKSVNNLFLPLQSFQMWSKDKLAVQGGQAQPHVSRSYIVQSLISILLLGNDSLFLLTVRNRWPLAQNKLVSIFSVNILFTWKCHQISESISVTFNCFSIIVVFLCVDY